MTHVAVALSRRTMPTVDAAPYTSARAMADSPTTLAALAPGDTGRVTGYAACGLPATIRRLMDLGFGIGEDVTVVRRAPLRDPVVYRVAGYEAALRRSEARLIVIEIA